MLSFSPCFLRFKLSNTKGDTRIGEPGLTMPKRRNVLVGLGALAVGSGATALQAAFNQSTEPGADFRIIAAGDLRVRRGPSFTQGSENTIGDVTYYSNSDQASFINSDDSIDWASVSPSDLPFVYANELENGNLSVSLGRLNTSSEVNFVEVAEIANEGSTDEQGVGIAYSNGSGNDGMAPANYTPTWFNNDSYSLSDSGNITRGDIQDIFQFKTNSSSNLISPDPTAGVEGPAATVDINAGASITLDLVTNLNGTNQVDVLASNAGGTQPFNTGSGVDFKMLEAIYVGTGWS